MRTSPSTEGGVRPSPSSAPASAGDWSGSRSQTATGPRVPSKPGSSESTARRGRPPRTKGKENEHKNECLEPGRMAGIDVPAASRSLFRDPPDFQRASGGHRGEQWTHVPRSRRQFPPGLHGAVPVRGAVRRQSPDRACPTSRCYGAPPHQRQWAALLVKDRIICQ